MAFLKNAWYCAGWSDEIGEKPFARMLLGEKLAFYRTAKGAAAAIGDVCPHHFAPLHTGKVVGESLRCPYHGIEFGANGKCTANPHGPTNIAAMRVSSYPIVERYGIAWIWMGDAARADPKLIPELTGHDNPKYTMVRGILQINGQFEHLTDNLLDLSHTQYLHGFFIRDLDEKSQMIREIEQEGDVIISRDDSHNVPPFDFTRFCWPDAPERVDNLVNFRWQAPANMLQTVHMSEPKQPAKLHLWGGHLLTPRTETSCHYFWTLVRDFRTGDPEFSRQLADAVGGIFEREDGAIIADIQEYMGSRTDFLDMQPALLRTDNGPIRARRILAAKIAAEQNEKAAAVA